MQIFIGTVTDYSAETCTINGQAFTWTKKLGGAGAVADNAQALFAYDPVDGSAPIFLGGYVNA